MSHRLFEEDTLFRQRLLSCSGFYDRILDGLWGPHTDEAEQKFHAQCDVIARSLGQFDERTERNVRSLRIDAQESCRRSLLAIRNSGHDARVISGTRTYPEQDQLYRKGRFGNPGPVVTRAKAGQSWHNFGLAWDIGLFESGAYLTAEAPYRSVAAFGKVTGIEWGGDWRTFPDVPHYQHAPGIESISRARAIFERGGRAA